MVLNVYSVLGICSKQILHNFLIQASLIHFVWNKSSLTIKNLFVDPTLLVERTGVLHGHVIIVMAAKPEVHEEATN